MEGQRVDPDLLPHDEYTYWAAAHHFGYTTQQTDDTPGVILDYMLAIEEVDATVRAEAARA